MTEITYRVKGNRHTLILRGHTGYGIRGQDIVCAAVSSHIFTLLHALEKYDCEIISEGEMNENGEAVVDAVIYEPVMEAIFASIADGLVLLSENYPEFVAATCL